MGTLSVNKIKKIINNDSQRRNLILQEKHYYENDNDIRKKGVVTENTDPIRNADNRISHNFHQLITDEKDAYMFTSEVLFDVGDESHNKTIKEVLGDDFKSESVYLAENATNNRVGWLHYWIDDDTDKFLFATVETEQCIPIFDGGLKKKLKGMYRYYPIIEEDDNGKEKYFVIFEYWTDLGYEKYKFRGKLDGTSLTFVESEDFDHDLGEVPFIEFKNNRHMTSDLHKYKDQIDLYDRVISGYANDLDDIQQLIYILENYGGTDLKSFLGDLKRYKAIKTQSTATGTKGGVSTLSIDIPVEARNSILEILKKQIYESGQALQQDNEDFGNASGVALKFFYRKLELKAGLTQTEFEKGFAKLIRAIMKFKNIPEWDTRAIVQTWTRNMISNDLEDAQIAMESKDIISDETIIKNHPWVENPQDELKNLKKQRVENVKRQQEMFKSQGGFNDDDDNDDDDNNQE